MVPWTFVGILDGSSEAKKQTKELLPDTLADIELDERDYMLIKRNYAEYVRVACIYGATLFSTGLQWSVFLGSKDASGADRKKMCHRNELCNYQSGADGTVVGWKGFNPDMVTSNWIYLFSGATIITVCAIRDAWHRGSCLCYRRPAQDSSTSKLAWTAPEQHGLYFKHDSTMYQFAGVTIILAGLLSGLYHTCASSHNQQFDYIGIAQSNAALFLAVWSRRHVRMPPAAIYGCIIATFIALAALQTSLEGDLKKVPWALALLLALCGFPLLVVAMHRPDGCLLDLVALGWKTLKSVTTGFHLDVYSLGGVGLLCFCYLLYPESSDSPVRLYEFGDKCIVLVVVLVVILTGCYLKTGCKTCYSGAKNGDSVQVKQATWRVVGFTLVLVIWYDGIKRCIQGLKDPNEEIQFEGHNKNFAHAVLSFTGILCALYTVYYLLGIIVFDVQHCRRKVALCHLLPCAVLFVAMIACAAMGVDLFTNDDYKGSAPIEGFGISCGTNGVADDSKCLMTANSQLTRDYKCNVVTMVCKVGSLDYNKPCQHGEMSGHSVWHLYSGLSGLMLGLLLVLTDGIVQERERAGIAVF